MNESTINDRDSILFGRGSVANAYVNSIHDTMSTIDTLSNYDTNYNGSLNQAQYSASFEQSQSGSGSVAYTYTTHDTMSDTLTNYNSNNIGSSNQEEYFEPFQELQSQSRSRSMGINYQASSVGTSVVETIDSVLMKNFTNTSNYNGIVSSFNT